MPVDDIYRFTISATGQGSIYQNVYALRQVTENPIGTADFDTFASSVIALWGPSQSSTITYTGWEATQLWGQGMTIVANECRREGGQQFAGVLTATGTGGATEALPPQSAVVVTWLTGLAGRRRRGRTYGFGFLESLQDAGQIVSTQVTALTTRLNTFIALYRQPSGTSPLFQLTVWSERTASGCVPATPPAKGHVPRDVPHPELASSPVTAYALRSTIYSQRRRTRGVGR